MPWFKVDDKLHSHKKAARAGADALGLWVLAGSWCADQLTDGFVPDYVAHRIDSAATEKAARLVKAGLWSVAEHDGDQGWQFHDWDDFQPTRERVEEGRADARERMRKAREAKRAKQAERSGEVRANNKRSSGDVRSTPTRPDPTRSSYGTTSSDADASSASTDVDAAFASFWGTYPRKVAKGAAKRAYKAAIKKEAPDAIEAALRQQLGWFQMQVRTDGDFRPHASSWLNQERWADDLETGQRNGSDDSLWGRLRGETA